MNALSTPRLKAPEQVRANESFEVRVMVAHPQETGYRRDAEATVVGRFIVERFECRVDGVLAFAADLGPGIAANPYFSFHLRLQRSGTLQTRWRDDRGTEVEAAVTVVVQ